MREAVRLVVELVGAAMLVAAAAMVDIALGLTVGGVILIAAGNFYMRAGGTEDADPE